MQKFKRMIMIGTIGVALAVGAVVAAGLNDHVAHGDLIVVPGNTVAQDGTPSPRLKARLDAALRVFQQGSAPLIFVSGGTGKEGFDEAISMSNYLLANGVPATAIVIDSLGINTAATAKNVAHYMRTKQLKSALVATQYFHVPRTALALRHEGVQVVGSVHARHFEMRDLYSTLRETIAFAVYYAKSIFLSPSI